MGLSASKRVEKHLQASPEFSSACADVYADCLHLSQHAFSGIKPYQLFSAAERLHRALTPAVPLLSRWMPHSPDRAKVDRAFRTVLSRRQGRGFEIALLSESEFQEFATELFVDGIVSGAGGEIMKKVPLGAAGIAAIGAIVRPGKNIVGAAIGAYAVGVVTWVYLDL
ncbi:hypothetical protein M569_11699, partial [Genlisea aurea]